MTALSVWWRRNFGHRNDPPAVKAVARKGIQVGAARTGSRFPEAARLSAQRTVRAALAGFGHRNTPPAMLPDRVTWTVTIGRQDPHGFVTLLNVKEGGDTPQERWVIADYLSGHRLRLTREDGAYRWRDDGFRGF